MSKYAIEFWKPLQTSIPIEGIDREPRKQIDVVIYVVVVDGIMT